MDSTIILGIETSCDETAAAIVADGKKIWSDVVYSQIQIHQPYGGVVPEIASRQHVASIATVVEEALHLAGIKAEQIHGVAVTNRPGLIGALLVGLAFAKGFAYALNKPLLAINHLDGHVYANFIEHDHIPLPAVCLLVSGGHTSLLYLEDFNSVQLLGATRDDAAGEAFDKVARFLGLGYPGGPVMEKAAALGQAGIFTLPRAYLDRNDFEFSFSGLKTATMNLWKKSPSSSPEAVYNLAAEFQEALTEVLSEKAFKAAQKFHAASVLIAGGVAANSHLRLIMGQKSQAVGIPLFYPSIKLCTDNAVMIAGLGYHHFREQKFAELTVNAHSGL